MINLKTIEQNNYTINTSSFEKTYDINSDLNAIYAKLCLDLPELESLVKSEESFKRRKLAPLKTHSSLFASLYLNPLSDSRKSDSQRILSVSERQEDLSHYLHSFSNQQVFQIISLSTFKEEFAKQTHDIEMDEFDIAPFGKPLFTSGLATCMGIVAKSFDSKTNLEKNILKQIGVAHDGESLDLDDFFDRITLDSYKVQVYAFGCFTNIHDSSHYNRLVEVAEEYSNIEISYVLLNPSKIDWSTYDQFVEERGNFGLSVGVDENGVIKIADESIITPLPGEPFALASQVERFRELPALKEQASC